MSPLRRIQSLKEKSLGAVKAFIKESILFYSRQLVRIQKFHGDDFILGMTNAVDLFRDFIFKNIVSTLTQDVAKQVLLGVEDAIYRRKRLSYPSANDFQTLSKEIYCLIGFVELIVVQNLQELNIPEIEQILQKNIINRLSELKGLRYLNLGTGSKGNPMTSPQFHDAYFHGIFRLNNLTELEMQYDCSDLILISLAENCPFTLRFLNMNYSTYVSNYSIQSICKFEKLNRLSAIKTGLSVWAKISILVGLNSTLEYFDNGEFLNYISANGCPSTFLLKEVLLSKNAGILYLWCPNVKTAIICHRRNTNYLLLEKYHKLEEIQIFQGLFHSSSLGSALKIIGSRLKKIALFNLKEIDEQAFHLIFCSCQKLCSLSIVNCQGVLESTRFYRFRPLCLNFFCLSGSFDIWLLLSVLEAKFLKKLEVGKGIMSDKPFLGLLKADKTLLRSLEVLNVEDPQSFTLGSLYELIEELPSLKKIEGLSSWSCLSKEDVKNFQRYIRINNYDVQV